MNPESFLLDSLSNGTYVKPGMIDMGGGRLAMTGSARTDVDPFGSSVIMAPIAQYPVGYQPNQTRLLQLMQNASPPATPQTGNNLPAPRNNLPVPRNNLPVPRNNLPVPRSTLPVSQGSKLPVSAADSVKWGAGLGRAANTAGRALGWASVVPAIYDFYNDAKSYVEGIGGTVPVLGADTMAMNGDEAIANLRAQQVAQQLSTPADASTVATGLANTVAQIPQQLPEIVDAQQAKNAMAGNEAPVGAATVGAAPVGAAPANATPVTQGLGNIRVPSMRNIDAVRKQKQRQEATQRVRKQKQRQEATQRVVRQSLPPQMRYTMQPTVSVQPYGNGGTQFNLNKNTMMFDDPDYQSLYALRAQQAQQALANTNQPVTYDQALAHARAGTTWR